MGRAFILPTVDFSQTGLGKVTLTGNIPVRLIGIIAPDNIIGVSYQLKVDFSPLNTTQRNIAWSIESGSQFASVSNDGLLTINAGVVNKNIVVKAVAQNGYATTKTISVSSASGDIVIYDWMKVSNGYVDLGIKASALMSIEIKLGGNIKSGHIGFFGASNDSVDTFDSINAELYWMSQTRPTKKNLFCTGLGLSSEILWTTDDIGPYTIKTDLTAPYVQTIGAPTAWEGTFSGFGDGHLNNLTLFGINLNGTIWGGNETQIWNTKIYDNNVLAHEYIAVTKNGTPYIYDKSTGDFLPIQGIGGQTPTITYGNET